MVSFEEEGDDPPPPEELSEILDFEEDEPAMAVMQEGLEDLGHDPDLLEEYIALDEGDEYQVSNDLVETPTKEGPLGYQELVIKNFLEHNPEQITDPIKLQDTVGGDKVNKKVLDELRKYRELIITHNGNYIN